MITYNMQKSIIFFVALCGLFFGLSVQVNAETIDAELSWAGYQRVGFAVNGRVQAKVIGAGHKVNKNDILAKLDARPFNYEVKHYQSLVERLDPLIFDAKIELDQASELYDRTVLSEVELQKVDGRYKALVSEQESLNAKLNLMKWYAEQSVLRAGNKAYVLSSSVYPGQVISSENQSAVYFELVSTAQASAVAEINSSQRVKLLAAKEIQVKITDKIISAMLESVQLKQNKQGLYKMTVVFEYGQDIEPGKAVQVLF